VCRKGFGVTGALLSGSVTGALFSGGVQGGVWCDRGFIEWRCDSGLY